MSAWPLFKAAESGVSHQVLPVKSNFCRPTCLKEREQTPCSKTNKPRPVGLVPSLVDALMFCNFFWICLFTLLHSQGEQLCSCFPTDVMWAPYGQWFIGFISSETGFSACHVNHSCNFFHSSWSGSAVLSLVVCWGTRGLDPLWFHGNFLVDFYRWRWCILFPQKVYKEKNKHVSFNCYKIPKV